jgi:hypothetical protein
MSTWSYDKKQYYYMTEKFRGEKRMHTVVPKYVETAIHIAVINNVWVQELLT